MSFKRKTGEPPEPARRRRMVRYAAAVLSGATAALYVLIGLEVVSVVASDPAGGQGLLYFGIPAGAAFALGTVLLLTFDRRILWILGAIFQLFAIAMYVEVAPERTPPYEPWGILIKIAQALILAALLYLIVNPATRAFKGQAAAITGVR